MNSAGNPPHEPSQPKRPRPVRRVIRVIWRWALRPLLILVAVFLGVSWGGKAVHAIRAAMMSRAERLTEDVERLERILIRGHPVPFRNSSEQGVRNAFDATRAAIARLERGEITEERVLAHFAETVASVRDPHTTFGDRYGAFGIFRIAFAIFGDDVRIVAAPDSGFLGARVLAFDDVPIAIVLDRIRRVVPFSTESGFLDQAPGFLRTPGLLQHVGASTSSDAVTLDVRGSDGRRVPLRLPRVTLDEFRDRPPISFDFEDDSLPRYRRTRGEPYWFEAMPERDALYVRYARASASSETPLADLTRRALHLQDSMRLNRVVVDLRDNPGGDPQAHIPLVTVLVSSPMARGPKHLRVLVDRGTFSAAVVAAGDLERRAGAVLIGEEPGDRAHLTTDARPFSLRHSGVRIWVPNGRMRTPGGMAGRPRLTPAILRSLSFDDWVAGRDPVLDLALAQDERPTQPAPAPLTTGRFVFDTQRALTLTKDGGGYRASVTGLGSDRLSPAADGAWSGGIHLGLKLDTDGRLLQRLPDGTWSPRSRLDTLAPMELALSGRVREAAVLYRRLTRDGADRHAVASLGLVNEGYYRYEEGEAGSGRALFWLAYELSPADPLIPLQHSLLRRDAEDRLTPPAGEFLRAVAACARYYREVELFNDWRLCL